MEEESSGSTGGIATLASVAFVVLSCTTMAVLAVMNHPHKAVLVLVGTMFIMARGVAWSPMVCFTSSVGRCWALCRSWSAYLVLLSLHRNPRPRLM